MKSMKLKLVLLILIMGMLSACGGQATETPASAPTEAAAPATEAPTNPPATTEAAVLPTETAQAQTTDPSGQTATVSFANDVLPILESRCVSCHGGDRVQEGLNLKTYADLMAGSDNGAVITAGDANNSLMAELVASQKMPKKGPKLTPPQIQLIIDWINQGAVDN